jgi:predicted PhzF superfamily epimerase YddE/YHI9
VNEDPLTGSVHRTSGPFLSRKLCKNEFLTYQATERGEVSRIRVSSDRVYSGKGVTVLRSELLDYGQNKF